MKKRQKLLTDEQWELVEPMLPPPKRRRDNRGRPWASNRACFEGILWILQTGAAWRFLPDEFPSPSTCWRRLKQWEDEGVWLNAWRTLLGALDEEGLLNLYVKYTSIYIQVLARILIEKGHVQRAETLLPLHMFLEFGASERVLINLMSLGLSRT